MSGTVSEMVTQVKVALKRMYLDQELDMESEKYELEGSDSDWSDTDDYDTSICY